MDTTSSSARRKGADDPGPHNPALAAQFPSSVKPPESDHGHVFNFWFPFDQAHMREEDGGWAREVTVKDLAIAKEIAGVNMRLKAGAIRELHWHLPAEWAYMLYGRARITSVDTEGRSFAADVGVGDLWYFPSGIPHSIQGLEPDGCEFLLAFDDGAFSEYDTFQVVDWMAHTPRGVLGKNFGTSTETFARMPGHELYIFQGRVPAPLPEPAVQGNVPHPFSFSLASRPPDLETKSGAVRIADSRNFTVSKTIAAALVEVRPGGLRELHWHPNADEWQYLDQRAGAHDGVRRARPGPHHRLPSRRCRVRSARDGALYREHRAGRPAVPGTVPLQPVLRCVPDQLARAHPVRAGCAAPQS